MVGLALSSLPNTNVKQPEKNSVFSRFLKQSLLAYVKISCFKPVSSTVPRAENPNTTICKIWSYSIFRCMPLANFLRKFFFQCDRLTLHYLQNWFQERMHAKKMREPPKPRGRPKKRSLVTKNISCDFCSSMFKRLTGFYRHSNIAHRDIVANQWMPCDSCR